MIHFSSILLLAIVLFVSCENRNEPNSATTLAPYDYSQLEGNYRGDFGGSGDIVVSLRHVTERNAVGFDLHKGLRRNISGEVFPASNGFRFVMHEPGDNQFDGIFEFTLDTTAKQMTGSWKPANMASLGSKGYTLKKEKQSSSHNAQEYTSDFTDSLGELHFEKDGLCIYRFYPKDVKGEPAAQYQEIKGNWRVEDKKYIVDWQKNDVFKNKQSLFKFVDELEGFHSIEGEGRAFYNRDF